MKKLSVIILLITILSCFFIPSSAAFDGNNSAELNPKSFSGDFNLQNSVRGAILCEASTGAILYSENELASASPASVTKIMTLLLVAEALDSGKYSLSDIVTVSAHAASMGGSQVFLEEGERISVEDLIKSAVIASGNDASVALAELTCGSEAAFVREMNKRAKELRLKATNFENVTGLDDTTTNHYSSAYDIAIMSRELIKHDFILNYSSLWQDSIRDGEFILTNTNRLVRYYDGCNGLKTGSTDKAGYCVSVTAKRGNMQLIAVIMGANTRDERNAAARELLDYGFANFALYENAGGAVVNLPVSKGTVSECNLYAKPFSTVVEKAKQSAVSFEYEIPEVIIAPKTSGEVVGKVIYKLDGENVGEADIYLQDDVEKIRYIDIFLGIIKRIICG